METSTTVPEDVSSSILSCLIPMAAEILYDNSKKAPMFQDIMLALTTLASSGSGMGHVQLFRYRNFVFTKNIVFTGNKISVSGGSLMSIILIR